MDSFATPDLPDEIEYQFNGANAIEKALIKNPRPVQKIKGEEQDSAQKLLDNMIEESEIESKFPKRTIRDSMTSA